MQHLHTSYSEINTQTHDFRNISIKEGGWQANLTCPTQLKNVVRLMRVLQSNYQGHAHLIRDGGGPYKGECGNIEGKQLVRLVAHILKYEILEVCWSCLALIITM